jgi:spore coat protein A, manganese oxidase
MRISRRTVLAGALSSFAGASVLGAAGCGRNASADQTAQLLPSGLPLPKRFTVPFAVPPVKRATSRTSRMTTYEIVQQAAYVEILPGLQSEIMAYDGLLPGPTIKTRRGEQVTVTHRNRLAVPTVVHLHGGHTPAESDGYPIDLVLPEGGTAAHHGHLHTDPGGVITTGSRHYRYPNDQPAATLWYHDHRMDFTGPQVWRGLAGFHLIADDVEEALDLPSGDRDVPLMIMDRSFAADGSLRYPALDPELMDPPGVYGNYVAGVLGDVILVNGKPWPAMEVAAVRYRFRILNGSNARRYRLALDPPPPEGPAFVQIASDGGLLTAPLEHDAIQLAAAERFDVVIDFGVYPVGSLITVTNALGVGSTDAVMQFRVARTGRESSHVPATLAEIEPLQPRPGAIVREWKFSRGAAGGAGGPAHWVINGRPFDPSRMDASVPLGQTEIWRFSSDLHHPVHVHLDQFQVLHRGNHGPGEWDHGWKDTLDLLPLETAEVAIRFNDHAGRFLLHCHNLEHEDMMMMSAFETLA